MLLTEPTIAPPIEDQILEAILSGSLPASPLGTQHLALSTLCSHFHLPLSKLLDILASPLTRSRIAAAQELRDLAFHQREQLAREKALTALESILDTTEDPVEKRRAATAILRRNSTRNPFWPRTPGAGAATDDDLDEDAPARTPLPPAESPQWCQPPRTAMIRLLTRLQDNHNPQPDSGLATLFLHKDHPYDPTPGAIEDALNDYLEDPGEDAALTNFSCAILHTPEPTSTPMSASALSTQHLALPSTHTERVTLHWPTHHRTVHFHFKATRNPAPNAVLWQIAHIDIGPKDTSAHDSS